MKRNIVAKYMRTFNKATVEVDKRQRAQAGYQKHKKDYRNDSN